MDNNNELTIKKIIIYLIVLFWIQLGVGVLVGVVSFIIYTILNPNTPANEISKLIASSNLLNVLYIFIGEFIFLIAALIIKNKYKNTFNNELSLKNLDILMILYILIFSLSFVILSSEIENIVASFIGRMSSLNQSITNVSQIPNTKGLILSIITIGILPAFIEEFLFRGLIQKNLSKKYGNTKAIIITSIMFALFHLNPTVILSIFLLSLMLGYVYSKTNKIIYPIILHFFNNIIVVIIIRYNTFEIKGINTSLDKIEHVSPYILLPALIIIFLISYIIYKTKFVTSNDD
ncbi:MAG: hypothetical protein A2Y34_13115 [Spirochaetes bacterium GWC1_27_15]|nr:MAG: hypothetical protein A2Z98_14670 [Spirochaetes bacterium GWB1_27_13]OHD25720.1 MAG: hypothetical protein A2Y34_13115 [Spirochaetes bacterium GWC1_27_15]